MVVARGRGQRELGVESVMHEIPSSHGREDCSSWRGRCSLVAVWHVGGRVRSRRQVS